jgi:large conductance mechanosensitive channel
MFKEFKEFISRGNVIDLAIGVIIGGAFGAIVKSLVSDILMPVVGLILGRINFDELRIVLKESQGKTPELAIKYGLFIQSAINFIIIAFVIFLVVKAINKVRKQQDKESPAEPTATESLLSEIRDLLKK